MSTLPSVNGTNSAQTTATGGNGVTPGVFSKPTGAAVGELLIAAILVVCSTSDPTVTPPASGQTNIGDWHELSYTGSTYDNPVKLRIFWKICGSAEPSSYTFTPSGVTGRMRGAIMRVQDFDPADPVTAASCAIITGGNTANRTTGALSSTDANQLAVIIVGDSVGSTFTLAGTTEQFDALGGSSNAAVAIYTVNPTVGSHQYTATASVSGTSAAVGALFYINPKPNVPPVASLVLGGLYRLLDATGSSPGEAGTLDYTLDPVEAYEVGPGLFMVPVPDPGEDAVPYTAEADESPSGLTDDATVYVGPVEGEDLLERVIYNGTTHEWE